MSHKASNLVKTMTKSARTGESLTTAEQLILWYIADCYNDESSAAWCGNPAMARDNGLSKRRVNEIIAELVRKEVIWREPRYNDLTGREMSNWWRFYEFDGEPPQEVKIWEEKHRVRGQLAADRRGERAAERKIAAGYPQEGCGDGCDSPQGEGAEDRTLPGISPQGEGAEVRTLGSEVSQGGGCGRSQGEGAEDRTQNLHLNLHAEHPQNPQEEHLEEIPIEPPRAAAEENRFAHVWTLMLAELARSGAIPESEYLRACVETTQLGSIADGAGIVLTIGVSSASLPEFYADHQQDFQWACREIGLDPTTTKVKFEPIDKAGRA